MKLLPKQQHAVYFLKDTLTEELLYGGAAGGGKSALGCLWLMEMCCRYPGTRWLMGRSKIKTLRETTLNTFFEVAKLVGLSGQFKYKPAENTILWNNGSQILLKDLFHYPSDPNYDSLGSLEITGAFIDECNQVGYLAWQMVKSRIRYRLTEYGLVPKILGTCNPAKNWVYKEFYKPSRDGQLPQHRRFVQSLPTDNPYLHPGYLKSLLRLDNNRRERLYYGNWEYDDDPAVLIDRDSIADYFNPPHLLPAGPKYMTIDVARKGRDRTVMRIWHGWLCIAREAMEVSLVTQVIKRARELQLKHNIPTGQVIADEDGVGGGVVDGLGCKGFVNNSVPLEVKEGNVWIRPNYENLKSQCSIKMAEAIMNRTVGELCHDSHVQEITAEEMEQVKIKDVDKEGRQGIVAKDRVKEALGRSPDEWDSIMMRYWFELGKKFTTKVRVG